MTIRVGNIVRCLSMPSGTDFDDTLFPHTFPGTAIVRSLEWLGRVGDWLQVERADGQVGCGDMYRRRALWVIQKRYIVKVAPRGINDPPTRYGPYVPIPKALP